MKSFYKLKDLLHHLPPQQRLLHLLLRHLAVLMKNITFIKSLLAKNLKKISQLPPHQHHNLLRHLHYLRRSQKPKISINKYLSKKLFQFLIYQIVLKRVRPNFILDYFPKLVSCGVSSLTEPIEK